MERKTKNKKPGCSGAGLSEETVDREVGGKSPFVTPELMVVDELGVSLTRCDSVGSMRSERSETSVNVKRKRKNDDTVECEESTSELAKVREIGESLRKFVFTDANKISKNASEFILNRVAEYEECVMRLLCANEKLTGRLEERVENTRTNVGSVRTYASVAGANAMSTGAVVKEQIVNRKREKERTYAVVVKATEDGANVSSEDVKKKVLNEVSKSVNVRVKAIRKTRNNGIAIETVSESEVKKLKACGKFKELGLKVEMPRKIGPKMIVYDIPNEMTNGMLMDELYERNLKDVICADEFKERVRIVHRTSKKEAKFGNVVIELSARARVRLKEEGRVFVNWCSYKARDFESVLRCHGCYSFGHMLRECPVKEKVCRKCGECGHLVRECKKADVCRNCKVKGVECGHSVLSVECPEYVRAVERMRARVSND